MADRPASKRALALLTVIAAPAALGVETLLRTLLFPPEFETVREMLSPTVTLVVWGIVFVTIVAAMLGLALQSRLVARALARLPEARREVPQERERARMGAFLLATALPQIPAVLATFGFMFGARFLPVGITMSITTFGVVAQVVRSFRVQ